MIEVTYMEVGLMCLALLGWARAMYWQAKFKHLDIFNDALFNDADVRERVLADHAKWKAEKNT